MGGRCWLKRRSSEIEPIAAGHRLVPHPLAGGHRSHASASECSGPASPAKRDDRRTTGQKPERSAEAFSLAASKQRPCADGSKRVRAPPGRS